MRSVGSTIVVFARIGFLITIQSFAINAISSMAAYLDHSRDGFADAFSQNGLILRGFLA